MSMKIQLTREYLLNQLPDGEIPEVLVLDGIEVKEQPEEIPDELKTLHAAFTKTEWQMFMEVYNAPGRQVKTERLAKFIKMNGTNGWGNTIAVHVLGINRKLERLQYPQRLRARLGGWRTYSLINV